MKPLVFVTGATGFVGRHLVRHLLTVGYPSDVYPRVVIFTREKLTAEMYVQKYLENDRRLGEEISERPADALAGRIQVVHGDLLDPNSVENFLNQKRIGNELEASQGSSATTSILINAAYITGASTGENEQATRNLIAACSRAGVSRIIHCSTAVVAGDSSATVITERTQLRPVNDYEVTKLRIEEILMREVAPNIDLFVLRPTAVFGFGGQNLMKLVSDRRRNSGLKNYLIDSVYGSRRLNLVSVQRVVAALLHFACVEIPKYQPRPVREALIVSADEASENNFHFFSRQLATRFRIRELPIPPVSIGQTLLPLALRLARRSNANPNRIYRSEKIQTWGFRYEIPFAVELEKFLKQLPENDDQNTVK